MRREQNPNLQILELAVERLGPLAHDMVFLGGCATGLLLTDAAAPPIRVTQDVDVITEVASLGDYHRMAKRLRERGFKEDQSSDAPICRWVAEGLVLDVMPTRQEILGFANEWYQPALEAAAITAFDGRGEGDYVMSHDMEDIIALLDGRSEIVDEVQRADEVLRAHLATRFTTLLRDAKFTAALPGHLPGDAASQARASLVVDRITIISENR